MYNIKFSVKFVFFVLVFAIALAIFLWSEGSNTTQTSEKLINPTLVSKKVSHPNLVRANCGAGNVAYMAGEYDKAAALWMDAASKGSGQAALYLGRIYETGMLQYIDRKTAHEYYTEAFQKNIYGAHTVLIKLEDSVLTNTSYSKQLREYFENSRKERLANSQSVGSAHEKVSKDYAEIKLYNRVQMLDPFRLVAKNDVRGLKVWLENCGHPDRRDTEGYSLVHIAAGLGRVEILRLLIDNHAALNVRAGPKKVTPLMIAIKLGFEHSVAVLLYEGANALIRNAAGKTAYQLVDKTKNPEMWDFFQRSGEQQLFESIASGNIDKARDLINSGISVNVSQADGMTPLMASIVGPNLKIFELLLHAGADPFRKNSYGNNAYDLALNQKAWFAVDVVEQLHAEFIQDQLGLSQNQWRMIQTMAPEKFGIHADGIYGVKTGRFIQIQSNLYRNRYATHGFLMPDVLANMLNHLPNYFSMKISKADIQESKTIKTTKNQLEMAKMINGFARMSNCRHTMRFQYICTVIDSSTMPLLRVTEYQYMDAYSYHRNARFSHNPMKIINLKDALPEKTINYIINLNEVENIKWSYANFTIKERKTLRDKHNYSFPDFYFSDHQDWKEGNIDLNCRSGKYCVKQDCVLNNLSQKGTFRDCASYEIEPSKRLSISYVVQGFGENKPINNDIPRELVRRLKQYTQ